MHIYIYTYVYAYIYIYTHLHIFIISWRMMICGNHSFFATSAILSDHKGGALEGRNPSEVHGHQVAVREKGASAAQRLGSE